MRLLGVRQPTACYRRSHPPAPVNPSPSRSGSLNRLYLHWPDGLRAEMSEVDKPYVIAAHGQSILFETRVPLEPRGLDRRCDPRYYPLDYFVYTAPSHPNRSPSLRRLPTRFKTGRRVDTVMDEYYKPHGLQQQRSMWSWDIGLLCHSDDEFTVAELTVVDLTRLGNLSVLHHTPAQTDIQWELNKLPLPRYDGTPDLEWGSWQTDIVIPFDGRYLCWVDLYLGLLLVDVIARNAEAPRYAPLPEEPDQPRLYMDTGAPDPARRVCVTDTGAMKLVSISDDAGRSVHECSSRSAFNITTWTLIDLEKTQWRKDVTIKSNEFWAALAVDKRLPHLLPEFPIRVNIKNQVLGAVTLYINEEEEEQGSNIDMSRRNVFCGNSFVTSQITRYMNFFFSKLFVPNKLGSLEMSKKLQEAKLERAMEMMDSRLVYKETPQSKKD
ncbi:hypothetical protein ACQ4PT_036333 [Festuca glaucescens]